MSTAQKIQHCSKETSILPWADEFGPAKVLYLHDPHCGLKAIVVLDNVTRGPAIGGVRMVTDVTPNEVFRLARAMTLKSAATGLPHGGGKAGSGAHQGSWQESSTRIAFVSLYH